MLSLLRSGLGGGGMKRIGARNLVALPKVERDLVPFSAGRLDLSGRSGRGRMVQSSVSMLSRVAGATEGLLGSSDVKREGVKGNPVPIFSSVVSPEMPLRTAYDNFYFSDSIALSQAVERYRPLLHRLEQQLHEEDPDTVEGFMYWLQHRKFLPKLKDVSDGEIQSLVRLNCFAHRWSVEALFNDTVATIYAADVSEKKWQGFGTCDHCGRGKPPSLYNRSGWQLKDCCRALTSLSKLPADHYDPKLVDLLADKIISELRDECGGCWPKCFEHMLPALAEEDDTQTFIYSALQDACHRSPAHAGVDTMPLVWNYIKGDGYFSKFHAASLCQPENDAGMIANRSIPTGPAPKPSFPLRMISHPEDPLAYTHVVVLEDWVDRRSAMVCEVRIRRVLECSEGSGWITGYMMERVVQTPMIIYLHLDAGYSSVLADIHNLEGVKRVHDLNGGAQVDGQVLGDW